MAENLITKAIEIVGLQKIARLLGVTYQAVRKWEAKGRLPRTEWTGETDYAAQIERATAGKVPKACLLAAQGWKSRKHHSASLPDLQSFATSNRGGKIDTVASSALGWRAHS